MNIDPILDSIRSPGDIKNYSLAELVELAAQIRKRIIEVLSVNGGHLASNLGMVELTIALHKVFQAPEDKIIYDVSHQTYAHKLLTGRIERFHQVRQFKGLCGFCSPKESEYDHFWAGHAGTALSLALGVAKSRDLAEQTEYVIPVIGDASLTCGLTLEALNNVQRSLKKFIVILNDNAMSISNNVGAITSILSRIINSPACNKLYQELESWAGKIPHYGTALAKQGHRLTGSLKNLVSSAAFFEQYGLSYVGPIDGHNLKDLIDTFEALKDTDWPVIVHVRTNKGQGMQEAVNNPITYHGVKPFDLETGHFLPSSSRPTFPKLFGKHLLKMAQEDESIVTITPAMSAGSCLDELMAKFPSRCIDVGIAEGHAVSYSGGVGYSGNKVVASVYSTFLQRAFDNIFHDVCIQEIPVVFAIDRAGICGPDGITHHGIYDIAFLNAMPNMVICQPRNGQLLVELLQSSFNWQRPAAIRYPNLETDPPLAEVKERELGKAELIAEGDDLLIIALGHMCNTALKVRELLELEGIQAAVLDPVFVKPLDSDLLCQLLITHQNIVTIEEHSLICGLGSILNHFLMTNGFNQIQVLNFGVPEAFMLQGSHSDLLNEIGLTPEKITQRILRTFPEKSLSIINGTAPQIS